MDNHPFLTREEDKAIIRGVQHGDSALFEALFNAYKRKVYLMLWALCGIRMML